MFGFILLGLVVVAAVWAVGIYNALVKLRVQAENAWSDIDVQLKRRWDLIPNLVETVKGYAAHEKETLEAVIQARNMAMSAKGTADRAAAENMLTSTLKTLFAVAEQYPQLRAIESFIKLQDSLSEIEDHIQKSRRFYNAVVRELNTKIGLFPSNIIANIFNFEPREFFELDSEAERQAPKVSFGTAS